jgi:uncharacterized protein YndB with AHSA1/START domain
MPPLVYTMDIACPPGEVFSYAADPSRFAEWQDDVVGVRIQGDRRPGVGTRFTTTRRIGRMEHRSTQEITEFSPPSRVAVRGVDGPLLANASITVEPLDDGARSRVTFTLDFHGQGIGKLVPGAVRQLAAKGAPRSYRNLKERLERGAGRAARSAGAVDQASGAGGMSGGRLPGGRGSDPAS